MDCSNRSNRVVLHSILASGNGRSIFSQGMARCRLVAHINAMHAAETPTIATETQVMFFDTDCAGVVHNIAYLRFIEVARTLLAEQLGMGLVGMSERGVFPVVVRTEIDYKRPAKLGDRLVVHGRLDSVERTRFWIAFEIKRTGDEALIVTSRQMLCVIQMPLAKPVALPADWGTRFAHLKRKRA
jgi:YbgC/YbaW family acyl-CoA thioester hydrolase